MKPCEDCQLPERWISTRFVGYEVSSHGHVRSLDRIDRAGRNWSGRLMALVTPSNRTYLQVGMENDDKKQIMVAVHRLMLESFISPPPSVDSKGLHWDDDPLHNHLANLRWGTLSQNTRDCIRNGNHSESRKVKCPLGHRLADPNLLRWKSQRKCRSCAYGRQYVKRHPGMDLTRIANSYYRKLTSL